MRETMDSLTTESTILRDLADFDTSAPIKATILFDDDSDENTNISIKSEYVTEDDTSQIKIVPNQLDVAALEVKKEIKEEPIEWNEETTETNIDKTIQQNIVIVNNTHQDEDLQSKKSSTDSRKRKQTQLQILKNKKAAKISTQINSSNNLCTQNNLNKDQSELRIPSSEYSTLEPNQCVKVAPQNPPQPNQARVSVIQNNVDSQKTTETCLSSVSDYMHDILKAYYNQKQNPKFKEHYKQFKNKLFTLSYNTVVEKLLPEEKNTQFIKDFVTASHHRACEKSANKCFYEDFEMLLGELINWTKYKISETNKTADINKISEQPKLTVNKMGRKVDIPTLQNNEVKLNNSGKSEDVESICIFSSGSPGREISINIDPTLQPTAKKIKTLKVFTPPIVTKGDQQELAHPENNLVTSKVHDIERNEVMIDQMVNRPTAPPLQHLPETFFQLPHNPDFIEMQQSLKEILKNNDTTLQPLPPKLPQIPIPLEMQHSQPPPVQTQFPQSTYIPTQYGQSSLVPPPNSQSTNLQQRGPSQHMQQQHREPPPYSQHANLQQHLGQSQVMQQQYRERGNVRTQQLQHVQIHHGQLQQVQPQLGHPQYASQQFRQPDHARSQYGPSQHEQRHYSQSGLLQYGHSNHMQQQVVQSQQVHLHYAQSNHLPPQNGQPKIGQSHVPPQHGPYARPNVGQSQSLWTHYDQSYYDRPANGPRKKGPPRTKQSQSVRPQHYDQSQHFLQHHEQSKYFPQQAGQSQPVLPSYDQTESLKSLLEKPTRPPRLEWQQELNALYNQGQIQSQNQKSSPRSASTDSGFISPLNFNVSADQTVGTPDCPRTKEREPRWEPPPEQSDTLSLLITHVTSLNPDVSLIEEGSCVVCKKPTKQKCMGCMKHYYCTYECQLQDWISHGPYCKTNNSNS